MTSFLAFRPLPAIAALIVALTLTSPLGIAQENHTVVSIQGDRFLVNGAVTHPGTQAEGLLLNSRMIQAIFDDENASTVGNSAYPDTGKWDPERNVTEFIAALPLYAAKGLRAVTVGLQGGSPGWATGDNQPGIITAFNSDGTPKPAWLNRLDRLIRAADQNGIVVMVSLFYFGQDHRLANETAVIRAVDTMTDWLGSYTNVLVEVNNETNSWYQHAILRPNRVSELITRIRQRSGGRLKVSTSSWGGQIPSDTIISASDYVLLHGNSQTASGVAGMVDTVRGRSVYKANPKPIFFNEDSTTIANLDAAVSKRASWGYFDQGKTNYKDGYQSPPVRWTINTAAKQAFFDRVAVLTSSPPTDPPPPTTESILSFTLIDADLDAPIAGFESLKGDVTINTQNLPTLNLNVRANATAGVASVRFGLNGDSNYRVENAAPFTLAGDSNGDYFAWTPGPGTHTVRGTPFSGSNASGTQGPTLELNLTLVTTAPAPPSAPTNVRIIR